MFNAFKKCKLISAVQVFRLFICMKLYAMSGRGNVEILACSQRQSQFLYDWDGFNDFLHIHLIIIIRVYITFFTNNWICWRPNVRLPALLLAALIQQLNSIKIDLGRSIQQC